MKICVLITVFIFAKTYNFDFYFFNFFICGKSAGNMVIDSKNLDG